MQAAFVVFVMLLSPLPAAAGPAPAAPTAPAAPAAVVTGTPRQTALTAQVLLKVVHPAEVRQTLIQAAQRFGGFPVLVTDHQLTLKVPPERLSEALEQTVAQGLVLQKTLQRQDLTETVAQLEARLRSKRDILKRLRKFFDDSNVAATLQIERNMTQLVQELEQVKGQLRVERERARSAVLDITFEFQERGRIVYVHSPFEWLNSVDLQRFLGEY